MKKKRGFPKLVGHDPPIVAIAFEWKIACWALLFLKQSISSGTPSSNPFVLLLLLLLLLLWLFSQHFPTFRFATRLLCWPKAPLTKRPEKENKMERNLPTHPRQKKNNLSRSTTSSAPRTISALLIRAIDQSPWADTGFAGPLPEGVFGECVSRNAFFAKRGAGESFSSSEKKMERIRFRCDESGPNFAAENSVKLGKTR